MYINKKLINTARREKKMDGKTPCGRTKKEGKHGGGKQGGCAHDFKKNDLKT